MQDHIVTRYFLYQPGDLQSSMNTRMAPVHQIYNREHKLLIFPFSLIVMTIEYQSFSAATEDDIYTADERIKFFFCKKKIKTAETKSTSVHIAKFKTEISGGQKCCMSQKHIRNRRWCDNCADDWEISVFHSSFAIEKKRARAHTQNNNNNKKI